jgi:hypothetical protein
MIVAIFTGDAGGHDRSRLRDARCGRLHIQRNQLLELAAVEPDATTALAAIDGYAIAIEFDHGRGFAAGTVHRFLLAGEGEVGDGGQCDPVLPLRPVGPLGYLTKLVRVLTQYADPKTRRSRHGGQREASDSHRRIGSLPLILRISRSMYK